MITVNIPDDLQNKLTNFAILAGQTPEQAVLEIIEERIDHQSAYDETAYLMKSETNRKRLDKAINDIKKGIYEERALIDD
ncbi:MAG: hypothetical protein ACE5IH_02040 [Thermodesulfobacteriota bacterium]